ncbi:MAG: YnhF family membrane protein [Aeromonas sp.]
MSVELKWALITTSGALAIILLLCLASVALA